MSTTTFSGPVQSLNGFTLPVLTSVEVQAIVDPTAGLTVFNSTLGTLQTWDGNSWEPPFGPALAPTVTSISPNTGSDSGGTSVVIGGTEFIGATAVTFGGTSAVFSVINSAAISATTPVSTAGAKTVAVTTPAGTGSLANAFTYTSNLSTATFVTGTDYYGSGLRLQTTGGNTGRLEIQPLFWYSVPDSSLTAAQPIGAIFTAVNNSNTYVFTASSVYDTTVNAYNGTWSPNVPSTPSGLEANSVTFQYTPVTSALYANVVDYTPPGVRISGSNGNTSSVLSLDQGSWFDQSEFYTINGRNSGTTFTINANSQTFTFLTNGTYSYAQSGYVGNISGGLVGNLSSTNVQQISFS